MILINLQKSAANNTDHNPLSIEMPLSFLQPSTFDDCLAERRETEIPDLEELVSAE